MRICASSESGYRATGATSCSSSCWENVFDAVPALAGVAEGAAGGTWAGAGITSARESALASKDRVTVMGLLFKLHSHRVARTWLRECRKESLSRTHCSPAFRCTGTSLSLQMFTAEGGLA